MRGSANGARTMNEFESFSAAADAYEREREAVAGRLFGIFSALAELKTAPVELSAGYAWATQIDDNSRCLVRTSSMGVCHVFNRSRVVTVYMPDGSTRAAIPAPLSALRELHAGHRQMLESLSAHFRDLTATRES